MMKDGLTKRVQMVMDGISKEEPKASTEELLSLWRATGEREENYALRRGKFFRFCMGKIETPIYEGERIVGHFPYKEWNCNRCCLPDPLTPEEREQAFARIDKEFMARTGRDSVPDFQKWRDVTLGGMLPDGTDGVNPLTYLALNATRRLKIFQPKLNARIWEGSPEEYVAACVQTARQNCGPMIYCDEVSIAALEKYGYSRQDARNYGIIGCYEMAAPGKECGNPMGGAVNVGKFLELAMNNGAFISTGEQIGPQTGYLDQFENLDQLRQAFQKQTEFALDVLEQRLIYDALRHSLLIPHALESVLVEGCLQSGRDVSQSGARLTTVGMRMSGLVQTADSFTALQKLVFQEKVLPVERLWAGIRTNFAQDEVLRAMLVNRAPKYGNDCDEADQMVRELGQYLCGEIQKRHHISGAPLRPGLFSFLQFMNGERCSALPDGHREGQPFANGVSPTHGADQQGLTAMLRSAAKLDYSLSNNAATLDVKLPLDLFSGENGVKALSQILRTFFREGGMQVQLYFLSERELREAQKRPEEYAGLIVRVTGYSAYFTELDKNLQEEVIMRTAAF